jgi:hypothetical protein
MAKEWIHHRYFRLRNKDRSLETFTSIDNARALINLNETLYSTGNPKRTYLLVDDNHGLRMTMEFDKEEDETLFRVTSKSAWSDGTVMFAKGVEVYKHEWLYPDGSISDTANF